VIISYLDLFCQKKCTFSRWKRIFKLCDGKVDRIFWIPVTSAQYSQTIVIDIFIWFVTSLSYTSLHALVLTAKIMLSEQWNSIRD